MNHEFVRRFPYECCAEVTRKGESGSCDKVAVAVTEDGDGSWWPVCVTHTRARKLVPLAEVLKPVLRRTS